MTPSLSVALFTALHEVQHLFRAHMRQALDETHPELTLNAVRVLMHIGAQPGLTQRELVEHSHADKAQIARLLAQLQQHGWLTRRPDPEDARLRRLHLSARGTRLFVQLQAVQGRIASTLLRRIPAAQQRQLLALLQQVRANNGGEPE